MRLSLQCLQILLGQKGFGQLKNIFLQQLQLLIIPQHFETLLLSQVMKENLCYSQNT